MSAREQDQEQRRVPKCIFALSMRKAFFFYRFVHRNPPPPNDGHVLVQSQPRPRHSPISASNLPPLSLSLSLSLSLDEKKRKSPNPWVILFFSVADAKRNHSHMDTTAASVLFHPNPFSAPRRRSLSVTKQSGFGFRPRSRAVVAVSVPGGEVAPPSVTPVYMPTPPNRELRTPHSG